MKFIGVDGCKTGWISVCFASEEILIFKNMRELLDFYQEDFQIFIDIPLGLPAKGNTLRNSDREARKLLPKNKKSSIFPVPCRESLAEDTFEMANRTNRKILGRGISRQTWFIMPKIKEVDDLLVENQTARQNIKESHPEISFQFLNGGSPLKYSKKTAEGALERLKILMQYNKQSSQMYQRALGEFKRKEVAKDDILDAMCLAITAELSEKYGKKVPPQHMVDAYGIEMSIHYAEVE